MTVKVEKHERHSTKDNANSGAKGGCHRAKLHILGCGSALPTNENFPTSQIFELRDKQYMIDCGEGTQIRMQQTGQSANRLNHIFISHLHGDHCFGLIGLISTFGMLMRTADLHIHAHPDLERIISPMLGFFCEGLSYSIEFHPINPAKHEKIYEDKSVEVFTIPLKHRVPACGFLFQEKEGLRHIKRDMIDFFQIPISKIGRIKLGDDFTTDDGRVIPNSVLTNPPTPPVRYAYCSDTSYNEKIIRIIENVDLLYHEATFAESESVRAKQTMHSTARQAATIAQKAEVKNLIIGHYSARYKHKNILLNEAKEVFENTLLGEDKTTYLID